MTWMSRFTPLLLLCTVQPGWLTQAVSQPQRRASLEEIQAVLRTSQASNILPGVKTRFLDEIELQAADVRPIDLARIREAAEKHFVEPVLYESMVEYMRNASDVDTATELLAWLESDVASDVRRIVDEHNPAETLKDYARRIQRERPAKERIDLVARYARAQNAGEFYVELESSIQRAAHESLLAVGSEEHDVLDSRDGDIQSQRDKYLNSAILSFLWRFEAVSDEQLAAVTELWESPSGKWYVGTYTSALSDAIHRSGERVVTQLQQ